MSKELYEKLQVLKTDVDNYLITSLNEVNFGAKLLLCDEKEVYKSRAWHEDIDYLQNIDDLMEKSAIGRLAKLSKTGILITDDKKQKYFVEKLANEKKVYICGAGHVSLPIIRMGKMLGFQVICIEDRPSFADRASLAGADVVICEEFDDALRELSFGKDSYFVVVTRGHHFDESCLQQILGKSYAYLGMMGSQRRVKMIKERLIFAGFDAQEVGKIHAPIGLDIKAQTPEEIAVSIWGEIIALKNENAKGEGFEPKLLEEILKDDENKVLATIIGRRGSAPRQVGTKMLITKTHTFGTIGGGCAEADAIKEAREMLLSDKVKPQIFHINMTEDDSALNGMVCGGVIDVLMEGLNEG